MLATTSQPASWPRILSTDAEEETRGRTQTVPFYRPVRAGLSGLPQDPRTAQPSNWPRIWSRDDQFDLQSRLNRLPFYSVPVPVVNIPLQNGFGGFAASDHATDLKERLDRLPFHVVPYNGFGDSLGDIQSDIQKLIAKGPVLLTKLVTLADKAGPYLDSAIKVVDRAGKYMPVLLQVVYDPAMPDVIARIKVIKALRDAKAKKAGFFGDFGDFGAEEEYTGVGLKKAIPLLDAYIYSQKNPAVPWLLLGSGILLIGGIGFGVGYAVARRKPVKPKTLAYRRRKR